MTEATTEDLLAVDPQSATRDEVDFDLVCEALVEETDLVRDRAADIMLTFADDDPESVLPALTEIGAAIDSDHVNVTNKAVSTVTLLTDDHLDDLEPVVEPLIHCLYGETPRTRAFAAKALRPIVQEHPEWLVPHVETLVSVVATKLDDPTADVPDEAYDHDEIAELFQKVSEEERKQQFLARGVAANLLYEAVVTDPSAGRPHVEALVAALNENDATVTAAVVDTIAAIGERDPIAIEDAVPALIDYLDFPSEEVRARAVKALGFSADDRAVAPLRELAADEEGNEDLRAMAAETADWIDNETQN